VTVFPDQATFATLARDHTLVPVCREIVADDLTPVLALARLGETASYLLESVTGGEKWARYSFVGCEPDCTLRGRGDTVEITDARGTTTLRGVKPFEHLRSVLSGLRVARVEGLPRFFGGMVGYVGWDAIRHFEPKAIERPRDPSSRIWDFSFAVGGPVIAFDALRQVAQVIVPVRLSSDTDPALVYAGALARIGEVVARLRVPSTLPPLDPPARRVEGALPPSSFDRESYEAAVRTIQEHIKAGDIFQAVLSQRFGIEAKDELLDCYRRLRVLNPSPYMFYVSLPEAKIAGASPETLVRLEQGQCEVRPIAGTRRRGKTDAEDEALATELLADPKERAEHVMLVDLGRNDLGRVCKAGSVRVAQELGIERYSHVVHMVSSVLGELSDDKDAIDLLASTFPAGTLSGAPKVRAIQIIDALEPTPREIYGGAVGYLGWDGNLDLAIAIRTIVERREADGTRVRTVQAGAGIVEASVPSSEYQETIDKARAALAAASS